MSTTYFRVYELKDGRQNPSFLTAQKALFSQPEYVEISPGEFKKNEVKVNQWSCLHLLAMT
jgi:hypothetical protein